MRRGFLLALARMVTASPRLVICAALALTIALGMEAAKLKLKTSQLALTPRDNPVRMKFERFLENFNVLDNIFVQVEYTDKEEARRFIDECRTHLPSSSPIIKKVVARIELEKIKKKFLYLIDNEKFDTLVRSLDESRPMLEKLAASPRLVTILDLALAPGRSIPPTSPSSEEAAALERKMKFLDEFLGEFLEHLSVNPPRHDFWRSAFFEGDGPDLPSFYDEQGYIVSKTAPKMLMIVKSSKPLKNQEEDIAFYKAVSGAIENRLREYPGLKVYLSGPPVATYCDSRTVKHDMRLSTMVSLIGISLLFTLSLGSVLHPLIGVVSLVCGIVCTFGLTQAAIGYLNLVSSTFTAILIGLGIGFAIHIVTCYEEERCLGAPPQEAVRNTLLAVGPGLLTGAATTSAAFYTMLLTKFTAFRELGLIAGTGLLLCLLLMMTLLPALLLEKEKWRPFSPPSREGTDAAAKVPPCDAPEFLRRHRPVLAAVAALVREAPYTISAMGALLFFTALIAASGNYFDYNLRNIQAQGTMAVENEKSLLHDFNLSAEFNALIVPDLKTAQVVTDKAMALPSVGRLESVAQLIPSWQESRKKRIEETRAKMESLPAPPRDIPTTLDLDELNDRLVRVRRLFGKAKLLGLLMETPSLTVLADSIVKRCTYLLQVSSLMGEEEFRARAGEFQRRIFTQLRDAVGFVKESFFEPPYTLETLPPDIREQFVGKDGRLVIYIFPSLDVRKEIYAKKFIRDTASIWHDYTGLPVLKDEMIRLIKQGFRNSSVYAFMALSVMAFMDFGSLLMTSLVMGALLHGVVFMLALVRILGYSFNPANFVALPLLLGMGIDNGVHLMHRYLSQRNISHVVLSTGRAICLNTFTSMIGFGSLGLSSYAGFSSLGWIIVTGLMCCLATALLLQPAWMELLLDEKRSIREEIERGFEAAMSFRADV